MVAHAGKKRSKKKLFSEKKAVLGEALRTSIREKRLKMRFFIAYNRKAGIR